VKLSTKCFAVVVRLAVEKLEKNVPPFTRLELFKDLTASPHLWSPERDSEQTSIDARNTQAS